MEETSTHQEDAPPNVTKELIVYSILAAMTASLFLFSCIILRRAYRLFKFTDLPMLLSITSITLALLAFIIVQSINAVLVTLGYQIN